jgi:hypothetical protein
MTTYLLGGLLVLAVLLACAGTYYTIPKDQR